MKKHLVLDCDEVLVPTWVDFMNFLSEKLQKSYNFNNGYILATQYFNITFNQLYQYFDEYNSSNRPNKLKPMKDSVTVLRRLNNLGFELFINTARRKETSETGLQKYAKKYFKIKPKNVNCAEYISNKPIEDKVAICKRIGTDVFIEDGYKNALDVAQAIPDALVLLFSQPCNIEYPNITFPRNMKRIANWIEAEIQIKKHFDIQQKVFDAQARNFTNS